MAIGVLLEYIHSYGNWTKKTPTSLKGAPRFLSHYFTSIISDVSGKVR